MKNIILDFCKRNILVLIMIIVLCPVLAVSYSSLVISSSEYRASEMYIGQLLYSLEINDTNSNIINIPANSEMEITLNITSLNTVSSNYIVAYNSTGTINAKYSSDYTEPAYGLISNTKTVTVYLANGNSNNVTVTFNIIGGYNTNELSDIEIPNGYVALDSSYLKYDLNVIAMFVDGVRVEELNQSTYYLLDSYSCTNDETVEWDASSHTISVTPMNNATKCTLYFLEDTTWYNNCNEKNNLNCKVLLDNPTNQNDSFIRFDQVNGDVNGNGVYWTSNTNLTEDFNNDGIGDRVYYYRGAVTNNYLIFANYCWRIIRTNEDGSVRVRFGGSPSGTAPNQTCPQTGTDVYTEIMAFNTLYSDNRYVGYMYGNTCDSYVNCHKNDVAGPMKIYLEGWYATYLSTFDEYISDAIYCTDRTISDYSPYYSYTNTKNGYGSYATYYGATGRLVATSSSTVWVGPKANAQPTYKCERNDDKFTVSNTLGNGKNIKPIGLITADEMSYAGGVWYNTNGSSVNTSYYLYTGAWYWGMSPFSFHDSNSINFVIHSTNDIPHNEVTNNIGRVLPVISLKSSVLVNEGLGTYNNPYITSY